MRLWDAVGGQPLIGHLRGDMDTLLAPLFDWRRKITWLLGAPFSGVRVPTAQKLARSLVGAGLH